MVMKILQGIETNLIVAIDIETVRIEDEFENLSEDYQSAWEYKNKQDGKIPDNNVLAELWQRTSSLYAEFSKICAVSLTYLNPQGELVCKEFYGQNEKGILEALSVTLNNMKAYNSSYRLVGHAAKYFDYPFAGKRYIINSLDIPSCLDNSNLKPWEGMNLCTNDLWKLGGTGAGSSLQALCVALGIPISKYDLVGDQVGQSYYSGEYERIGKYCSKDSVATFNVIRKFKKEPIFQFDDVTYIVAYSDEHNKIEEKVEQPILQQIYKATNISQDLKIKIEGILKKKKLTKKDRIVVEDILVSIYIDNTMFKSDTEPAKERKRNEIKEILDAVTPSK